MTAKELIAVLQNIPEDTAITVDFHCCDEYSNSSYIYSIEAINSTGKCVTELVSSESHWFDDQFSDFHYDEEDLVDSPLTLLSLDDLVLESDKQDRAKDLLDSINNDLDSLL